MADLRGIDRERGPKSVIKAEVETANVLPKTLEVQTELMPFAGATVPMFAVYGRVDEMQDRIDGKKVWCATFLDSDEAMAWVQASRVFGRAVKGAVIKKQENGDENAGSTESVQSRLVFDEQKKN